MPTPLKEIKSCGDVAAYTLRALADALESCAAKSDCCTPRDSGPTTDKTGSST